MSTWGLAVPWLAYRPPCHRLKRSSLAVCWPEGGVRGYGTIMIAISIGTNKIRVVQ